MSDDEKRVNDENEPLVKSEDYSVEDTGVGETTSLTPFTTTEPHDELTLNTLLLTPEEVKRIPNIAYTRPCLMFFRSFEYVLSGAFFNVQHFVWWYMLTEIILYFIGLIIALFFFGLIWGIIATIMALAHIPQPHFGLIERVATSPIFLGVLIYMMIFDFILFVAYRRTSSITEHIMKGRKNKKFGCCFYPKTGRKFTAKEFCCYSVFWPILTFILKKLFRYFILSFLVPFLLSFLNLIFPPFGNIIWVILTILTNGLNLGFGAFCSGVLDRKYLTIVGELKYLKRNFFMVLGYGLGMVVFLIIPVIGWFYLVFFSHIGATRLYLHMEHARKNKKEEEKVEE